MFLTIAFGLCLAYLGLYFGLGPFFNQPQARLSIRSIPSLVSIIVFSLLTISIGLSISDLTLGNRVVHALGGGFISIFVCFLATRDSQVKINRFQFFVFSFMFVTTLGVVNEIMEFFLQYYFAKYDLFFATTINDTWLDLLSNTVGILVASIIFVPFVKKSAETLNA